MVKKILGIIKNHTISTGKKPDIIKMSHENYRALSERGFELKGIALLKLGDIPVEYSPDIDDNIVEMWDKKIHTIPIEKQGYEQKISIGGKEYSITLTEV